jgi:hypothetical protein
MMIVGLSILCCVSAFIGCTASFFVFGKQAGAEGIRDYLDRKEEELNQKIKRKTF